MEKAERQSVLQRLEQDGADFARNNLLGFALYTRPHYKANWHHALLCQLLDKLARREIKRLMVFMPPRHGKSELVSRCFPAYLLGRNPNEEVIACSYSAPLASRMNRDVQRLMDHPYYANIFPNTKLSSANVRTVAQGTWLRNSSMFEVVNNLGSYRAAGVGGGITGMGADVAVIDDPIKNQEEAYSLVHRDKVWDWYTSTLYPRLEGESASVLITLTRWHEDDLAGRLLDLAKRDPSADQWTVLSLPAVKENNDNPLDPREIGEALWPDKFPVRLLEKNKANGTYFWNALFQQRPAPPEGSIIRRDWLKYYDDLPEGLTNWIMSWDLTFDETEKGSYVVGQVWARKGANCYVVDQYRERVDFPGQLKAIVGMIQKWPQARKRKVEKKANGAAVLATLKNEIPGFVAVNPKTSKTARLHAVSHMFEAGNVWLPRKAIWTGQLVEELVTFPASSFNDQVDATTQALDEYKSKSAGKPKLNLGVGYKPVEGRYI